MKDTGHTTQLQECLQRLHAGDEQARDELLRLAEAQLRKHARRMLRGYPHLQRWEQTDDVLTSALLRLHRALADVKPTSVPQFFGLANVQIRRELIDLARHHFGPHGDAAHHVTQPSQDAPEKDKERGVEAAPAPGTTGSLEAWVAFHEQVALLPDDERQIVDLIFYQEMSQTEAAVMLGVDERTVRRRWQSARLILHEKLNGQWPES